MADLLPQELRVLVAVAGAHSFTGAAEQLGSTQSAVSHTVRTVERKLGAVLFERGRLGAAPTPAGERAVAHARRVLRMLDTLAAEVRSTARGTEEITGPLRIAAFRSAATQLLPAVLGGLRRQHPGLEPQVVIVREIGRGTAGEVADGRADLAIATLDHSAPPLPGLVATPLFREPYALVHPAGAADPRALPLVDWVENCGSYTRDWWRDQDWLPGGGLSAEDDVFALSLVAQGLGMSVMPWLSLVDLPAQVSRTDLGPEGPTRQVGYVTTADLARTGAVRALIRALRSAPLRPGLLPVG
ncbi:LysR family transcriptional regulator [Streptacidiphilus pinicola]|uniref:LysR family transcriptional regulator n=1 Tax=Streptacidiphilus pinicola TaxID=2219663 RepID=A0A2X0K1F2_9ACTN|nr:LysR family transcriptional regulator [Streptacidiphilus pinicola]RAG81190.1 LysR family transcriptional regulator [Streptacidiphilus pinicola]